MKIKNYFLIVLLLTISSTVVKSQTIESAVLKSWDGASGDIEIPYGVDSIAPAVFKDNKNITSVKFPNSLRGIAGSAFYGCTGLTEVVLPPYLKRIMSWNFANCTNLTRLTFGENIEFIGSNLLDGCIKMQYVISEMATPPATQINLSTGANSAFAGVVSKSPNCKLVVPTGSIATYKAAKDWEKFGDNIVDVMASVKQDFINTITVLGNKGAVKIESAEEAVSVQLFNVSGQLIFQSAEARSAFSIPASQGIYIVKIKDGAKKVIVY